MHKALARLTYPLVPVDPEYPWAVAATSVGVSMVRQQQIDLIWATNPLGCHCLARRIWHRTGVPYVLDFRDVRRIDHTAAMSSRDRSNVRVERDVLWDAAGVTYVSPPQVDTLIEKHSFVADKPACLVYNWFEADEIAACSPQPFEQPTILHGGSLYGGARRLEGVLAGLSVLRQRRAAQDGTIHLVQYATESRVGFLARPVADYDLQQVVHIRPSLPRSQFLSACRGAAILLLVVGHDKGVVQHAGAIPGKLYDYFAACRPVLVVGPRDCEAGKMVRRLNRGLAVPDDAPEKIAEAIELLLQGRGDAGRLDLTHEAVREFEAARAVEKMARFLSKVCEG